MHPDTKQKNLSPDAKIQLTLLGVYLLVTFSRYLGSTGISSSSTFSLDLAELTILTVVYLLQAIPMALLRLTKLAFFKLCFLVSQVLGILTDIPALGYMSGSAIYGGFIEFFNQAAGYACLFAILVHICLFFYVKGTPVKSLVSD
jgi:hypothetical protein